MKLEEGRIIAEHYQLKKQLGNGSFGNVWLAHNLLAEIDVAIKFYGSFDEQGLNEFRNEFKVAYKLNHPNLLNISHFDVFESCPYLVMPYCANGSVSHRIGQMPEDEIWKFVHDVASGLAFLHSQQPPIIHQDIKPDNILITCDGRYLISDFGISRNLRTQLSHTMNNQNSSGTLAYMGPERFSEQPMLVLASDIWAFGMTLYEVLTGNVLWEGMGGCVQLNGARIPNIQGVSTELVSLISSCLSPETWNRPTANQIYNYATAKMQHRPLPCLGNHTPEDLTPCQPHYKPQSPKSFVNDTTNATNTNWKKRAAIIAAVIFGILVLTGGAVLFINNIDEEQDFISCKTRQDYEQFINEHPNSSHVGAARSRIAALTTTKPQQSSQSTETAPVHTPIVVEKTNDYHIARPSKQININVGKVNKKTLTATKKKGEKTQNNEARYSEEYLPGYDAGVDIMNADNDNYDRNILPHRNINPNTSSMRVGINVHPTLNRERHPRRPTSLHPTQSRTGNHNNGSVPIRRHNR